MKGDPDYALRDARDCGNRASWRSVRFASPTSQEALLSCSGPRAITPSGTLFNQFNPVIDMRKASQNSAWRMACGTGPQQARVWGRPASSASGATADSSCVCRDPVPSDQVSQLPAPHSDAVTHRCEPMRSFTTCPGLLVK
ncbi:hypothetical protein GCM10010306_086890 [Streptomyces umbrinus]|nr:hypothetical protein GCM10010306_086890 [Streptomyces umbrinus]